LPYPKESLLDRLNAADDVVLARESPDKLYHLSVTKVLRGSGDGFELFLPSAIKRTLEVYPDWAVLAVNDQEWRPLGIYRPEQAELLDQLLVNDWGEDKEKRARFFAQYLNSSVDEVQKLAHIEVARAPYALIRELQHPVTKGEIVRFLGNQRMAEWHALYILLLVQMADERDAEMIRERFRILAEHHLSLQLAAWTLAFLEVGGTADEVAAFYVKDTSRDEKELKEVIGALGTYGSVERREEVLEVFIDLLGKRPDTLVELLPWLEEWQAYTAAEVVAESISAETDFALAAQARSFLKKVEQQPVEELSESGGRSAMWLLGGLLLCALALPFVRSISSPRE
jgi:hypothetical protein